MIKRSLTTLAAISLGVLSAGAGEQTNSGGDISPDQLAPQVATNNLKKIPNWGTDILHYYVRDSFTNGGILPDAAGRVDLKQQAQGHSARQQLSLTLRKLEENADYTLLSAKRGETNYTEATTFQSDKSGKVNLKFKVQANGNGKGNDSGKGHKQFPAPLSPLIELESLGVADVSTQLVMHADLLTPDRLQYHIKRKMEGAYGVGGLLKLQGTTKKTLFRLEVLNLLPTNSYWLAFNGQVVSTNSTDKNGRLQIKNTLTPPITPASLTTVELLDTGTNVLLYTELP